MEIIKKQPPVVPAGTTQQYYRGDKTWQDFFGQVRAATLTGLSIAVGGTILATDTVLQALGKIQNQIDTGGSGLAEAAATILVGDWIANEATKTVSGITPTNIVFPSPTPASADDWAAAGIIVTGQDTDELSFMCKITPTVSINVNIAYQ